MREKKKSSSWFPAYFCAVHIYYGKGGGEYGGTGQDQGKGMDGMDRREQLLRNFGGAVRAVLEHIREDFTGIQEIRMRADSPLFVFYRGQEYSVSPQGVLSRNCQQAYVVTARDIKDTVELLSQYSMYAYEDELRQGYITVAGGHRVGMAGKIVMDGTRVKTMRYISFLNIRLSHQVKGCAQILLPHLTDSHGFIYQTLILSPPRCGKTTLLRDLIRLLSDGTKDRQGVTVGVADERSEIAACYLGKPQNDLGKRTDVLDGCPKAEGMMMLIRTMAPQVVAVDEIGGRSDLEAMEYVVNCGCRLIATVHGSSFEDLLGKPVLKEMVREKIFERFVVLGSREKPGSSMAVLDGSGKELWKNIGGREKCHGGI